VIIPAKVGDKLGECDKSIMENAPFAQAGNQGPLTRNFHRDRSPAEKRQDL
jgi:hypothetical protein